MCLHYITKKREKNTYKKIGYKVFKSSPLGEYFNLYFDSAKRYKIGDTVRNFRHKNIKTCSFCRIEKRYKTYESGFHIFETLEGAENCVHVYRLHRPNVIVKVVAEDIRTYGTENDMEVFVSQKYTLLEEVKGE